MGKILGKVLITATVAVVGILIVNKEYPRLVEKVSSATRKKFNIARDEVAKFALAATNAFQEGYNSSARIRKVT